MKKIILVLTLVLIALCVITQQASSIGVPTVGQLLGQEIAGHYVQNELQRIMSDMSHSGGLENALKKYEKKLKKLRKKHAKQRKKEERTLQRLINDMKSYSRQDSARGNVNRQQEEKQRKLYEYAEEFKENDRIRAREIEEFHDNNYPRIETY